VILQIRDNLTGLGCATESLAAITANDNEYHNYRMAVNVMVHYANFTRDEWLLRQTTKRWWRVVANRWRVSFSVASTFTAGLIMTWFLQIRVLVLLCGEEEGNSSRTF